MSPNDHHTPVPRAFSIPPPDSVSDPLAALDGRLSVPAIQLQAPGPDDATLLRLLRSAVRVPDVSAAVLDKDRSRWLHAPVIVVAVARLGPDAKIPERERLLTAGCTCFALLQAAQAVGFRGCWLTGWAAYDRGVARMLGLQDDEHVIGFIHLGTPKIDVPERERPDPADLISEWSP